MKKKCKHCGTTNEAKGANPITPADAGFACKACRDYRAFLQWYRDPDRKGKKGGKRSASHKQDSLQHAGDT